jgi:hypothetical protein
VGASVEPLLSPLLVDASLPSLEAPVSVFADCEESAVSLESSLVPELVCADVSLESLSGALPLVAVLVLDVEVADVLEVEVLVVGAVDVELFAPDVEVLVEVEVVVVADVEALVVCDGAEVLDVLS